MTSPRPHDPQLTAAGGDRLPHPGQADPGAAAVSAGCSAARQRQSLLPPAQRGLSAEGSWPPAPAGQPAGVPGDQPAHRPGGASAREAVGGVPAAGRAAAPEAVREDLSNTKKGPLQNAAWGLCIKSIM